MVQECDTRSTVHRRENLLCRLDRCPMTVTIWTIVILLMMVWIVEAFDIGLVGPSILIIKKLWHLTPIEVGQLGSAGTLGIVLGLLPAGWIGDRYGRKRGLIIGICWFSVFTLLSAVCGNVRQLEALRFLGGLGEGAVFPIPYLMIAEFLNKSKRGFAVGVTNSLLGFAYMLTSLVGFWVIRMFTANVSWRVLYLGGGAAILLVPMLWKWLPESPRFLLKIGQESKVRQFVESLEIEAGLPHDLEMIDPAALNALNVTQTRPVGLKLFFTPTYFRRCFVAYSALAAPFVLFYLTIIYGPSLFHLMGASKQNALLYTAGLNLVSIGGNLSSGYLSDVIGRRATHVLWMIVAAISAVVLGQRVGVTGAILAAAALWWFGTAGFPVPKLYMAEQFPTALRTTGVVVGECVTRFLTGVVLVYYTPLLMRSLGVPDTLTLFAALTVVLVLPMAIAGESTAGVSVEVTGVPNAESELT